MYVKTACAIVSESFFKSVQYMDTYLKNEKKKQDTKDIHLIGVTCMFSAVKYE